jgi:hypothetical protein
VPNHKLSKHVCQDPLGSSVDNDFANRRCNNNNNNNNNNNKPLDGNNNNSNNNKLAEVAELIEEKSPYYKCTPTSVLEYDNFKL